MIYEKYVILTKGKEETDKVYNLLFKSNMINIFRMLTLDIILMDSTCGAQDWMEIIEEETGIKTTVMLIEELYFTDDTPKEMVDGMAKFISDADISDDINYFLDLMSKNEFLTGKQQQRLRDLCKTC